jgi:hypothetical protein
MIPLVWKGKDANCLGWCGPLGRINRSHGRAASCDRTSVGSFANPYVRRQQRSPFPSGGASSRERVMDMTQDLNRLARFCLICRFAHSRTNSLKARLIVARIKSTWSHDDARLANRLAECCAANAPWGLQPEVNAGRSPVPFGTGQNFFDDRLSLMHFGTSGLEERLRSSGFDPLGDDGRNNGCRMPRRHRSQPLQHNVQRLS